MKSWLRRILALLIIIALIGSAFYYITQKNPAVAALTVDTSTASTPTQHSFQRKTFFDTVNGTFWTFYYNGTNIEYSSATGAATSWTSRGTYTDGANPLTNDFSLWFANISGTPTVYIAYAFSTTTVKVNKGTLDATSISWGTAGTANSGTGISAVSIARDTTGILFATYNNNSGSEVSAISSSSADDVSAWDAEADIITSNNNYINGGIVPLTTSGHMYAVATACNSAGADTSTVRGALYNGSWQAEVAIQDLPVAGGTCAGTQGTDMTSIVSSATDKVHLIYMDQTSSGTTGEIRYRQYNGTDWTTFNSDTPVLLSDSSGSSQYPTLSIDTDNSNRLYAFWYKNTGGNAKVVYRDAITDYTTWDAQANVDTTSSNIAYVTSSFYASYLLPVLLTSGSGSPYSVVFNSITINSLPDTPSAVDPKYGKYVGSTSPSLSFHTNSDYIYMEYGNDAAGDNQDVDGTWASAFMSVHHMKETGSGAANEYADSTSNANHGQGGAGVSSAVPSLNSSAQVNGGQTFDGTEDYIYRSSYTHTITDQLTICAWIKPDSLSGEYYVASLNRSVSNFEEEFVYQLVDGEMRFWDYDGGTGFNDITGVSSTTLSTSAWNFVCFVRNGTSGTYYYNGASDGTKTAALSAVYGTGEFDIGKNNRDLNKWFDGGIDEVRIINNNYGTTRMNFEYKTQSNTLNTFSSEMPSERQNWQYRKRISFDNSAMTTNISSPTILVKLTSSNFDFTKAQSAGQDIRFYDADGISNSSTAFDYEIESWDSGSQVANVWVQVPTVSYPTSTDYIKYKVLLYSGSSITAGNCAGSLLETGNQVSSQTGFTGQDAQTSTAYLSQTIATYTVQATLTRGNSYCWQVQAYEPAAAQAFGTASEPVIFTVSSTPAAPTLFVPPSGATGIPYLPLFMLRTTDADSDYLQYKIVLYGSDCSSAPAPYGSVQTFDQNASQTNWQNQNAYNKKAYMAGTSIENSTYGAYLLTTTALNPNTTYCWKGAAIDPTGSNTYSSFSSTQTFTTGTSEVQIRGGTTIQGGTLIQ